MLLITITKGATPDARRELNCYIQAYSAQPMQEAAQSAPQVTYNAPMNGAGTPRTGAA